MLGPRTNAADRAARMIRLLTTFAAVLVLVGCSNEAAKRRHLENGIRLLESGRVQDAIIELSNAVDRDELWGEARYKLAEAYAANGEIDRAFREYVRAADLLPRDEAAQLKAATYLLLVGQHEDARTRAERVLERNPRNPEALIVLGNALAGLKDLDGAVAEINQAIALDPGRSQSYSNLAIVRIAQGRNDEAKAAFAKAVETDPTSVAAWLAQANFEWSVGDVAGAETSLTRAYDLDETNILTRRALAAFFVGSGRASLAEEHLRFVAERTDAAASSVALADYYAAQGRSDEARRILEPLTRRRDAAAVATTRLAALAYAAGETANAHDMLDQLLRREPNSEPALLLEARWLLAEGSRERALARARAAVAANPRNVVAHYMRGLAESASHRSIDAIKSFTEVLHLNPRAAIAQVHLSRLHLIRNAVDTAVLFAEEALRNAPDSVDARLALVRAWIARGDHRRAEAELSTLKRQAPEVAPVHALDGSLQMILGDRAAARTAFVRAVQLDATSSEALGGLVTLDVVQGKTDAAEARIDAVRKAGVATPEVLLLAGKVYAIQQDLARSRDVLRQAIELDPLNLDAPVLLGQVLAQLGELDSARAEFDGVIGREPGNLAARLMAALIVHAQGNLRDAKRRYDDLLKIEPRAALAANNLAAIYADERANLDLAQQLAESAADQFPAHPEVQDTLGWVYYQRQVLGQAIRQFERSIAADPDNASYHYHLGMAYAKNREPERARRALQTAVKLDPDHQGAQDALASLRD